MRHRSLRLVAAFPSPVLILAISFGGPDSLLAYDENEGPDFPIAETQPAGSAERRLSVWRDGKELLVSAEFPQLNGFVADSWCYESAVEFLSARSLGDDRLEVRHRPTDHDHLVLVTNVTQSNDSVDMVARWELDDSGGTTPSDPPVTPNLCWQLRRCPGFRSKPDPYPEFVERCFIFTERGMTMLDETRRSEIPVRDSDDPKNNPPWVQMYVGAWQESPVAEPTQWSGYSPDRYTTRVIGTVSRDGKHLAALANGSARLMAQAWHDCLHNNAEWLPADRPLLERSWRVKFYVLPRDPQELLRRVRQDFPLADKPSSSERRD